MVIPYVSVVRLAIDALAAERWKTIDRWHQRRESKLSLHRAYGEAR
jgi:hypothetical protein